MKTDVRINNAITDDNSTMLLNMELSPEFLATLFWSMNEHAQARFFNHLAHIAPFGSFAIQMGAMINKTGLTDDARALMRVIGDHADETPLKP